MRRKNNKFGFGLADTLLVMAAIITLIAFLVVNKNEEPDSRDFADKPPENSIEKPLENSRNVNPDKQQQARESESGDDLNQNRLTDGCVVTGCSGQVCADSEIITTCEWLPEYACYRSARCERQPNGECGWTPTPELTSCLVNP